MLNALSPAMHRGTGATHYGRRGHIPGSVNVPALTLLDANFCFLGSAGLTLKYSKLLTVVTLARSDAEIQLHLLEMTYKYSYTC